MGHRIEVTAGFCILWAFWLLVLPLGMIVAAGVAALLHEGCHGLAIWLTGGKVLGITLGAGGMVMEIMPMSPQKELVCALAGPVGSLLLAGMYPWMPLLAVCGLVQGLFNLIPIYPLDGGRAIRCAIALLQK